MTFVLLAVFVILVGSLILAGRNHYRGRSLASAPVAAELEELKRANAVLEERNKSLVRENASLASALESVQRAMAHMSVGAVAPAVKRPSVDDDGVFVNPMTASSELSKNFDDLGEVKKEKLSDGSVEKLRKLLGR